MLTQGLYILISFIGCIISCNGNTHDSLDTFDINSERFTSTLITIGLGSFIIGVLCLACIVCMCIKFGCKNRNNNYSYKFKAVDLNDSEVTTDTPQQSL